MATPIDLSPVVFQGETYHYLEPHPDSWRKQLFLKGRNMAVVHLVYAMRANHLSAEQAAEDYDLPLEQVQEALLYYRRHRALIEQEQEQERRFLAEHGIAV